MTLLKIGDKTINVDLVGTYRDTGDRIDMFFGGFAGPGVLPNLQLTGADATALRTWLASNSTALT